MKAVWNRFGIVALAALSCMPADAANAANAANTASRTRRAAPAQPRPAAAQIEEIVHNYLLEHPEVLIASIQRFQQRYQAEAQEQKREAVGKLQKELQQDPSSPTLEPAAQAADPVSIVAFLDYQCGYCKRSAETLSKIATMPGVRIVFKEFPILGPDSLRAAKAALAARNQNAYQQFHQALMKSEGPVSAGRINEIVATLKLDSARFNADMESPEIAAALQRNGQLAEKLGVQSTPTFVIGKEVVPGAITEEGFKPLIEAARHQQRVASAQTSASAEAAALQPNTPTAAR